VIVAAAGADTAPIWLRIVIALVPPVLAAIIAGYFALSNTVNRRSERFKNLNEVRKDYPERINPGYAVELIILRELKALDRATTPNLRWRRRIWIIVVAILALGYTYIALLKLGIINDNNTPVELQLAFDFILIALFASGLFLSITYIFMRMRYAATLASSNKRYERAFAALKERAVQADQSPSENEQQDVHESEFTAETSAKIQQPENLTDSIRRLSGADVFALAVAAISGFVVGLKSGKHCKRPQPKSAKQ
jgi:hypothetical protein